MKTVVFATLFSDVPPGSFAVDWIEDLYASGVTAGCGSSLFCPSDLVTRAQMAAFLLKASRGSSYTPPPASGVFGDVPASVQVKLLRFLQEKRFQRVGGRQEILSDTRVIVPRAISTRSTEPSFIHTGPSGKRSPVAIVLISVIVTFPFAFGHDPGARSR